ncbi:MAG TPA: thioesterase family protein [Solirubrobacterales bacterium]|nr:thioesterase family protein [Solirubrobacterales bacterium]
MTHPFDIDTAVEDLGGGRFGAEMSERWWVERGPNGGYVAAVVLRAIQAAVGSERAPRSLTVHFPSAPLAGPVEIAVSIDREGRSASFVSARMEQDGELRASALAMLGGEREGPGFSELEMPSVEPPAELYSPDPATIEGMPPLLGNYSFSLAIGEPAFQGEEARSGAWLRAREPRELDAPLATAMLDAWFPAPFVRLRAPALAPTIDYTVHFRSPLPPPGAGAEDAYLLSFRSGLARGGFFEEDGELWSADGELLAHSRQLALLIERRSD